jgi:protein phosphatase 1 regulatory subunit 10
MVEAPPLNLLDLQARRQQFQLHLKELLVPSALSGAGAVKAIVSHLDTYILIGQISAPDSGSALDVDIATRLEPVTKTRDNTGNHFFPAWAENLDAMEIFKEELKAGATEKDDGKWEETNIPSLHESLFTSKLSVVEISMRSFSQVIERLPLTLDQLKTNKLGKIILKLTKEPSNSGTCCYEPCLFISLSPPFRLKHTQNNPIWCISHSEFHFNTSFSLS